MKRLSILMSTLMLSNFIFAAELSYKEVKKAKNPNTKLTVLQLQNESAKVSETKTIILFKTNLAVNTDGSPHSYNSINLTGGDGAVNVICNAIVVTKRFTRGNLCKQDINKQREATQAFRALMENNWIKPKNSPYNITYKNVLSLTDSKDNKIKIPCIFEKIPEYKGYFGSETALKNALEKGESGECGYKNQVDSLKVSGFVLPSLESNNPLNYFGADKGDLLFVYDPLQNTSSFAIVNDRGDKLNSGEGSVKLLMNLNNKTSVPTSYTESKNLAITRNTPDVSKSKSILNRISAKIHTKYTNEDKTIVIIFANSRNFALEKPYTEESIKERGIKLIKEAGFGSEKELIEYMKKTAPID